VKTPSSSSCYLPTAEDTELLGARLGENVVLPGVIYLQGELGAGKTTLCRGLLRARGYYEAVKSPTFTLVEPYELESGTVYHFDLYRLGDVEELVFIGMRDYCDAGALILVEWPERGETMLPEADLVINLSISNDGRMAEFTANSRHGQTFLPNF